MEVFIAFSIATFIAAQAFIIARRRSEAKLQKQEIRKPSKIRE